MKRKIAKLLVICFFIGISLPVSDSYAVGGSWKADSIGWWYEYASGGYARGWTEIDGYWYFFTGSGYMDYSEYRDGCWLNADGSWNTAYTGGHWASDTTGWWYTDASGWYPVNTWLWIDGNCYYFKNSGYMASNEWIGDNYVDQNGSWIPGYNKTSNKNNDSSNSNNNSNNSSKENTDYSNVKTDWVIQEGYFTAGIDIPAGVFDVEPLGGGGFLSAPQSSANLVGPEVKDEYAEGYSRSYKNFILEKGDVLEISGLKVKIKYKKVLSDYSGRSYKQNGGYTLSSGNFVVGEDIPSGRYNVKHISGSCGTVTTNSKYAVSNNPYSVNANMGNDPDEASYFNFVSNVVLVDGEIISVSSGMKVLFIPEIK